MTNLLPLKELTVHVVEPEERRRKGAVACRLGQNIKFDIAALESFSSLKWQPVVFDALVVAAVVEFCDRSLSRSSMNWGRRFVVHVPVHEPFRWSDKSVVAALVQALNLLTGDDWHFEFRARKVSAQPPAQFRMEFPSNAEAVIAFSDGMDSRAVDGLERKRLGQRLIRVRVGNKQQDVPLKERRQAPFAAIPYSVSINGGRNAESSARSRGFKFSVVSAMAAYLIDAHEIIVPESGQGAIGPAFLPVGQGYEDYRSHPVFTVLMERFIKVLLAHQIRYKFPRLWTTKAETLREFANNCSDGAKWIKTRSCWQQSRQVGVSGAQRQCGICAACVLRRLSVHAAGLQEPPETYVWESLQAPTWEEGASKDFKRLTTSLREYAIAGVLHFEHLALIRKSMEYELFKRRHTGELARSLAEDSQVIAQRLDRMLEQHTLEWYAFKDALGRESFVRKWIGNRS
ncbi:MULTISPECIES: 7-cyano-7-deazaguanine synthase [unclassified Janthinobacterium]|uniref:7-cyano-7-deazaguanine synthase n=1 Tax=unclassified Janthinobacterium TaxID=2610881 RepID=UPI00087EF315|nr:MULTISPECIES: 7-cyano-7-deazaguanine synthase [unclassified Janthinobacterium]SDA63397.1 7-cyano-7-deazaguanine synthase (queuosine biosynthesis) [Janthinobacterium sp. 551a]SFB18798.1 7-cyano-7-deazaguanine synthase (queuosine biosynthesis) [Janthinobacterium sp. 344]